MMTREVYSALKTRMTVKMLADGSYRWDFDNTGLNEGIDCFNDLWIDSMTQRVFTSNIWNCAQRAHSFIRGFHKPEHNVDARLIANPLKK